MADAITVGQFTYEDGGITGPGDYMNEKGNARLDSILAGTEVVFNMTAHLSPSVEIAILVNLQTDYAGWIGARRFMKAHGI